MAHQSSWIPKRDPVTINHIQALHHWLDHIDAFDIAIFSITCVAFWCCWRFGKLIIDSSFDPKAHIFHSTMITHGTASNGLKFIHFDVPHTKTKPEGDCINIWTPPTTAVPPKHLNTTWMPIRTYTPMPLFLPSRQPTSHGHLWGSPGLWTAATRYGSKRG